MCLISFKAEPETAKVNIRCDKLLLELRVGRCYVTPHQGYPVEFDSRGVAELRVEPGLLGHDQEEQKFLVLREDIAFEDAIIRTCYSYGVGIHSYYRHNDANRDRLFLSWGHDIYDAILMPAVIPEGAKYIPGTEGEIVSSELLVFRDEAAYEEWVKDNGGAERLPLDAGDFEPEIAAP